VALHYRVPERYLLFAFVTFTTSYLNIEVWSLALPSAVWSTSVGYGDHQLLRCLRGLQFIACSAVLFQACQLKCNEDHWEKVHSDPDLRDMESIDTRSNHGSYTAKDSSNAPVSSSSQGWVISERLLRVVVTASLLLSTGLFLYYHTTSGGFRSFLLTLTLLHHLLYIARSKECGLKLCRPRTLSGSSMFLVFFILLFIVHSGISVHSWTLWDESISLEWIISKLGDLESLLIGAGTLQAFRIWRYEQDD
jgi:hypothetical protein